MDLDSNSVSQNKDEKEEEKEEKNGGNTAACEKKIGKA